MNFSQKLEAAQRDNDSLLILGLDLDPLTIPRKFRDKINSMFEFGKDVVDQVVGSGYVCGVKPNAAWWTAVEKGDISDSGDEQLIQMVEYIHNNYPKIPVILDAKRGDIFSTGTKYALEVFEKYKVDAVTISGYMGKDAVTPFTAYEDKGIIVICRTSNPSAGDIQDLQTEYQGRKMPVYEVVARKVFFELNENNNCLLVMGGIRPDDKMALTAMENIRTLVGDDMDFLVPGVWEQNGDVGITVNAGKNSRGSGMGINSSSGITGDPNPSEIAKLRKEEINQYR
jgi:orotidine-5'-phosphate decarboxylase